MVFEYTNQKFEQMRNDMEDHFITEMCKGYLFRVNIDFEDFYNYYLDSYPTEIKGIYREKSWHDCSACRKFLKKMANVISINKNNNGDYEVSTMFDFNTITEYKHVMYNLDAYIRSHLDISSVFLTSHTSFGLKENYEDLPTGEVVKHSHFYTTIPVDFIFSGDKVNKKIGEYNTNKKILESTLETIHIEAVLTVLNLIDEGTLYRGSQWRNHLVALKEIMKEYIDNDSFLVDKSDVTGVPLKDIFLWFNSMEHSGVISRIKNTSMGVLLTDITNGVDLEDALRKYESIVAPQNYRRPKPIFTQQMVENAEKKLDELGYLGSINRRFACSDDLDVNNILYVNRGTDKPSNSVFDDLKKDAIVKPKSFNNLREVTLNEFTETILPQADEVYLYMDNQLDNHLVSLITSEDKDSKSMFQWDNNFSWAYKNNIADSLIKQQVKKMGGDVDVDLRFSIEWNNIQGEHDANDLDAHCILPNRNVIYYARKNDARTGGWLDVDIVKPNRGVSAVENIRFKHRSNMVDGDYIFTVFNYDYRGGDNGFNAEIEFDGNIYNFKYPFKLSHKEEVRVAKVTLKDGVFQLDNLLEDNNMSSDGVNVWGVKLNTFVRVDVICYSPNYWGGDGVGLKHLFFFLKDCQNPSNPNAWFNEFLNNELNEHRKVMEALSSKCKIDSCDDQLSGVGLSVDRGASVIVKIKTGNGEELYKVNV